MLGCAVEMTKSYYYRYKKMSSAAIMHDECKTIIAGPNMHNATLHPIGSLNPEQQQGWIQSSIMVTLHSCHNAFVNCICSPTPLTINHMPHPLTNEARMGNSWGNLFLVTWGPHTHTHTQVG